MEDAAVSFNLLCRIKLCRRSDQVLQLQPFVARVAEEYRVHVKRALWILTAGLLLRLLSPKHTGPALVSLTLPQDDKREGRYWPRTMSELP